MGWGSIGTALQPVLGFIASIPGVRKAPLQPQSPKPFKPHAPTPREELDAKIERLSKAKQSWVMQSCAGRVAVLQQFMRSCTEVAPLLASDCAQAKGGAGPGQEM